MMRYGERADPEATSGFTVSRGAIFVIMGGSGCGKSTLLRHMVGCSRRPPGDVNYDGVDFGRGDEPRATALPTRFGMLFQSAALWSAR